MRSLILAVVLSFAAAFPCLAQTSAQTREVVHTVADLNANWFVTNWVIGNVRQELPNNLNLFPGLGYRHSNWWLEAMVQRQWSNAGNSWALDFRYEAELSKRIELYLESAPLLSIAGEYEFVFVNVRIWKRVSVGAETENVHKAGADSLGAGPRISLRSPTLAITSWLSVACTNSAAMKPMSLGFTW